MGGGTADDVLADYPYTSEVDGHPGYSLQRRTMLQWTGS